MADELMSAIPFFTTPKGDLPHYSYIFRNLNSLGTEMKNVAYSRLGTMLHLYIQKGEEATETPNFRKYLRGTAACMKIIIMTKKGWDQLISNDTYFSDRWFSGVKKSE